MMHQSIGGKCCQCRNDATHKFHELGTGSRTLLFCCECYSMATVNCFKPGLCGEAMTAEDWDRLTKQSRARFAEVNE